LRTAQHGHAIPYRFNGGHRIIARFKEPIMPKQPSIRDQLETDAWRNYPQFAERRSRQQPETPDRRPLRWEDRALLILAAVLMLLLMVRVETARADEFWGLEFSGEDRVDQTMALNTSITAEITGLVARIDVTQVFENTGPDWAEAVYRFPLPEGAAVDRVRVEAGNRLLEGEIREKEEARREYAEARAAGKLTSLVEQQRANQFKTRLANIAAGETIRVSISFLAHIDYRDGTYGLQIPMTFTPRWDPHTPAGDRGMGRLHRFLRAEESNGHYLELDIRLNTGLQLASLESRYHDIDIHPALNGYQLYLADPDTRTDRVFELNWTPEFGHAPESTLMTWEGLDATYALLMLAPPLAAALDPQPREVVFIIDTSGSMRGTSLTQARAALLQGLEFLEQDDYFNLVEFNSDARLLFRDSAPATPGHLDRARDFIHDLEADGGTNMAPALDLAMDLQEQPHLLRQIVFVTDGSVGNERDLLATVGEQLGDSRLFTVSIGPAPNAWFMRKAAAVGRGSHTRIGKLEEVEETMSALWTRIENPAVQDLCVDWGMDAEFYPEIIPDLYAGEPLWLYARLPRAPQDVLVCGELDGRYWENTARLLPGGGSDSIATLWARSKVEALEDSRIFGVDPETVRREVVDLALEFGLLTRYTSMIAVDRTPVRPGDAALETRDVANLVPAGSTFSSGFSQTAAGWKLQLLLSLIALLVTTGMLVYLPPSRASRAGGDRQPAMEVQ
jgi:Ca-activated chloride channel family protein